MAYLKFVANPNDSESILRVINVPKRGIGESAVQKLIEACAEKRVSLIQGILDIENMPLTNVIKNKIRVFSEVVYQLREKSSMPLVD